MRSLLLILFGFYLLFSESALGQSKSSTAQSFDFVALIARYRAAVKAAQSDSVRTLYLFQLANKYSGFNEDSAVYFAQQGIIYAQKLRDKRWLIQLNGQLGRSYARTSRPQEALDLLKKAEQLGLQYCPKDSATADVQLLMASFYTNQGNHQEALPKALAALRICETNHPNNVLLFCRIYNTLGIVNTNLKRYPEAIAFLEKQRALGKSLLGGFYVYLASTNLADIYLEMGQYEKAEVDARRALAKARELNYNRGIAFGLKNLADAMNKTKRYADALDYGQQSLQMANRLTDKRFIGQVQINLAETHLALHQYDKAADHASQAITLLRTTSDRISLKKALEIQGQIMEQTNDYQAALLTFKEAKALNDSLFNVDKAKVVSRIQGSFDLERKENQIQLLNKNLAIEQLQASQKQKQLLLMAGQKRAGELQNQLLTRQQQLNLTRLNLQDIKAKRQQILITQQQDQLEFAHQQRMLYLAILALLMVIIGSISYFFSRQQRAKQLLAKQKAEIEQQALQLTKLNATKDKLFSLIGHDLRSPVASMKNSLRQLRANTQQGYPSPALMDRLDQQVDNVLTLLTSLLDWSMIQLKGFQLALQPVRLSDVTEEALSQMTDLVEQKQLYIINQVKTNHLALADRHQIRVVVRNLVANAIKFTPSEGYIRLASLQKNNWVELHIRDSGLGMSAEQIAALFTDPQIRAGTQGEYGTGLGLRICWEMVERQEGQLQIESREGEGTFVRIRLAMPTEVAQPNLSPAVN